MEALILTVFVSLVLSAVGVGLYVWDVRQGGHDHHDRLALLPLEGGAALETQPPTSSESDARVAPTTT